MIALLVMHATNVPRLYSDVEMPGILDALNTLLGPYRMPTLMVLSGMLLHRSLSRSPVDYYERKLRTLLWPYLVWAVILLSIEGELASIVHPQSWIPVTYIWFLLFVFLYYCAAPLLRRVPAEVVIVGALIGSWLLADRGFLSKFVLYAAFFALGHLIGGQRAWLLAAVERFAVPLVLLSVALLVLIGPEGAVLPRLITITGILGLIGLFSKHYRASRWSAPLEAVGRDSMVYYLSHFPAMIGITLLVAEIDIAPGPIVAVACLVTALALGAVLARHRGNAFVRLFFSFPSLRTLRRPRERTEV